MKYCKRCVQPDTRPHVKFDDEGICGGCRWEESKKTIDWDARKKELQDIADWAKENSNCSYDCVIGVSGGKDSHYQVWYAKYKLGLNPLCVCNAPDGRTKVGTHNLENLRSKFKVDLIEIRPDLEVMRALTKRDFLKFGNLVKSSEYSLWASAYRVAVEKGIPLVIQGENPELIFGLEGKVDGGNALTIKDNNTIEGCNADDLVINKDNARHYETIEVPREKLDMFDFPEELSYIKLIETINKLPSGENYKELEPKTVDIKGVFLQYYDKNWGQVHNTLFSRSWGLKGRYDEEPVDMGRSARETSVDGDHLLVNQYLKYLKFGFGYETDWQCYLIREIGADRDEAIDAVKRLDNGCHPRYIKDFCDYIGITMEEFFMKLQDIVNPKLFYWSPSVGDYVPTFKVGVDKVDK